MHYSRSSLTKKQMWQKQIKGQGSVGVSESSSSDKLVDMQNTETEGENFKPFSKKMPRNVSFHPTAFVVLIPTADEYHQAGLGNSLWWEDEDFRMFKQSAMEEIREFVRLFPNSTCGEILKKYYETLLSEDETDDIQYPISPNSVAELTQCLEMATKGVPPPDAPVEANFLFRSSSERVRDCGIGRSDSVQLHKLRLEDLDLPGVELDPNLSGSMSDSSPLPSPKVPVESPKAMPESQGFAGIVPILANAAAMLILSLVQSE